MPNADAPVTEEVVVEMSDTDMTRFIHFASVVEYFEVGLRGVMEAADLTFRDLFDRGIGTPIVNAECDYQQPMYYGNRLTLHTSVERLTDSTFTLGFELVNEDHDTTATGSLTLSCYDIDEKRARELPDDIRSTLESLQAE